jgi:hypothetical protein
VSAADKPFSIDKKLVYEAYKAVRANAGGAGWIDRRSSSSKPSWETISTSCGTG